MKNGQRVEERMALEVLSVGTDRSARRSLPDLEASQLSTINSQPSTGARVMYMPGGLHRISCGLGGVAAAEVSVVVDRKTASDLQASLMELNASQAPQRALFDKEHEHKEAMAWPVSFEWSESPQPGVYVNAEFSSLGKEFVEGKVVRAFSGSFYTDADLPKRKDVKKGERYAMEAKKRGSEKNPARITDLAFPYAGTFTNNPAFRDILPLWAKATSGATGAEARAGLERVERVELKGKERAQEPNKMLKVEERATLQAKLKTLEAEIETLTGEEDQTPEIEASLAAKRADLEVSRALLKVDDTEKKLAVVEAALLQEREKEADGIIKAAVKRGKIPARDLELQASWKKRLIEDPTNATLIDAIPGKVALSGERPRIVIGQAQVSRESSSSVLNAFSAETDPRKRAVLYATEIRARLDEGDPMPLHAANNVGTLAGTLVTQRTLELLKLQFPVLNSISTDFSDQSARLNQTIDSRIVTIPAVQDYDPVNGWPDSDAVTTDVPVVMNKQKGVQITFTADVLASTVRRLFDEFGPAQAYALAKAMVDDLYALFLAANYTNAATVAALINFSRSTLIDVGVALDGRGVPDGSMNRFALLNASYFGALKKDNAIVTLAAYQDKAIIEQGVLPDVEGFKTIKAVNLPATANLVGFAGSKSAAVMTARVDADYTNILPGASYGNVTTVTDPDLGLSVLQVQYVNHQKASASQRISLIYGVAKGQNNAGQLIKSA